MLFGTWVTTIAGFGYIGVGAITGEAVWSGVQVAVWAFLTLRLLHGMSTGFRPTGTTAFLTDITPLNRRGEALGYLGVAGNAGMAGGPAIGSWLTVEYGYNAMFIVSTLFGLIALVMTLRLPETLPEGRRVKLSLIHI